MPAKNYAATAQPVSTVGNSQNNEVVAAEYNGTVTAVTYTPNTVITGANTNSRTLNLVNKGQTGGGSTVVASLAFVSGVNAPQGDEKALTLSGTAANLVVAAGDVLELQSTAVGTGIADPGGLVKVNIDRTFS